MSESIDTAARERLEALVGTWGMEAGPPGGPPWPGAAEVTFACKYEGADIEIGFNPQFLTEALRVVDTDEISLELTAPNRPGPV